MDVISIRGAISMPWNRPRHKFNAIRTESDGRKFSSKREARYYEELKLRRAAGEVLFFLWQVPLHLAGGVRYVIDFLVFFVDGHCEFTEIKGFDTPMGKMKRRLAEAEYPIQINVIK